MKRMESFNKNSPLYLAVESGSKYEVEKILKRMVDCNYNQDLIESSMTSAFLFAADKGNTEIMELLLTKGVSLDTRSENGETFLHLAVFLRHKETVQFLIDKGVNINAVMNYMTPLFLAAMFDHIEMVKLLLKEGADVNIKCFGEFTPFLIAAVLNFKEIVELFLEKTVDIYSRCEFGMTVLHKAAMNDCQDIVEVLLERGMDVDITDNGGLTPLHVASICGFINIVELLLNKGANVNAKDKKGQTAIHRAIAHHQHQIVEFVLGRGAHIEEKALDKSSLFYTAVEYGNEHAVQFLIEIGVNIHFTNELGETALHLASRYGFSKVAELLIENGVNIHFTNELGETALHLASRYGFSKVAELLIENGVNLHAENIDGKTALDVCGLYVSGWIDCVFTLIKYTVLHSHESTKPFFVKECSEILNFWYDCEHELKKMRGRSTITLYKFLKETNVDKFMNYLCDDEIERELKKVEAFPIYANLILNHADKWKKRAPLLYKSYIIMKNSVLKKLPSEIREEIAFFLTNTDLKKLIEAAVSISQNT